MNSDLYTQRSQLIIPNPCLVFFYQKALIAPHSTSALTQNALHSFESGIRNTVLQNNNKGICVLTVVLVFTTTAQLLFHVLDDLDSEIHMT